MKNRIHQYVVLLAAFATLTLGSAVDAQVRPSPDPVVRDETADRVAIQQLVIEYYYLLDHGRATEIAALFTPDAVFDNPNMGLRAIGREAIAAYFDRRAAEPRTTRHISTNLRLVFETPDRASGTRTILYYRGDGDNPPFPAKPGSVGEYSEVFQRGEDSQWRFASRKSQLIFIGQREER